MIEVRCFGSLAEAAYLREEVNALNLASARPDPFSTFEFFENYLQHDEYLSGRQGMRLWFLAAFLDGRLVGYLALKQVLHKVLGLRTFRIGFLVEHNADRPHLVAAPRHMNPISEAFYAYLLGRKREWSLLEFQQQDDTSTLFPPPAAADISGCLVRQWPSLENGTISIRWRSLHEYLEALAQKPRSNVSRQVRNLFAAGNVEWLASSDPVTTPVLFDLYRGIEPRSWKSRADATIDRHPERIEYFRGLLDVRQPMRTSIQVLLLDGTPIAGLITGAFMRGLYALHMVYDDRLSRLAPGSAMMLMGLRQAIDGQYAFLNLLSGFGYYKTRWLAEITETRIAQIYRSGSLLFWHRLLGDWKRQMFMAGPAKTPMLFNPVRRDVGERGDERVESGNPLIQEISHEEQAQQSALIAEVRKGRSEYLPMAELAAQMPFETQRASKAGNARGL